MSFLKHIGKAFIIGNFIFVLFLIFFYFTGVQITFESKLLQKYLQYLTFSVVLYMANAYLFHYLKEYFTDSIYKQRNFIISSILAIMMSVLCIFLIRLFFKVYVYKATWKQFIEFENIQYYWLSLAITTIITGIFYGINYWRARQESRITEQKIIAGTASAKFTALKNQLDPHFLFNSLNVLTSLIEENPKLAQKFTTSLSKVYRYVLEQRDKELVTVDEELSFAKTYMTLLKLRFENSIIIDIPEVSSNPEAKVVPLSLQILLENTIKHNIVMPSQPLHIKIFEKEGFLIVENNLQTKNIIKQSTGVGLFNIQQRYRLLTKKAFSIYKTDMAFIAKLPILTKRITIETMGAFETTSVPSDLRYNRAKEQVEKIKGFYGNLVSYCIVIPVLFGINFYHYQVINLRFPWALFPAAGWGIGLFFHYCEAFDWHPIFGKGWEKRKIKEYMKQNATNNNSKTNQYE